MAVVYLEILQMYIQLLPESTWFYITEKHWLLWHIWQLGLLGVARVMWWSKIRFLDCPKSPGYITVQPAISVQLIFLYICIE